MSGRPAIPSYDQFLHQDGERTDDAYRQSYHRPPSPVEVRHTAWRQLWEGWTLAAIVQDILQPTDPDVFPGPLSAAGRPDYATFLHVEGPQVDQAYRAKHGHGIGAKDVRHNAYRRLVEGWDQADLLLDIAGKAHRGPVYPNTFDGTGGDPGGPVTPGVARPGIVRGEGSVFVDDAGAFLPIGATLFWLAWGFKFDRDRLTKNLQFLADRGVDYVRGLGTVGPKHWTDRVIDPGWPDYDQVIAGATDLAYNLGLRVHWTIFGGVELVSSKAKRDALVRRFAGVLQDRAHKVFLVEVANEAWQNGFSGDTGVKEAVALASVVRKMLPNLVATTAPATDVDAKLWNPEGGPTNVSLWHPDRNVTGEGERWRPVRQAWEFHFQKAPGLRVISEPIGPQSSLNADADPLRLAMTAATGAIVGCGAYTYHAGAGIRGGGKEDAERGRVANFWDVENVDATLQALRHVRAILPADVPGWEKLNVSNHQHFRDRYPFDLDPLLDAQDGTPERMLKAYCARQQDRFVIGPMKVAGAVPFVAKAAMQVQVFDPLTGSVMADVILAAGQTFVLDRAIHGEAVIVKGQIG